MGPDYSPSLIPPLFFQNWVCIGDENTDPYHHENLAAILIELTGELCSRLAKHLGDLKKETSWYTIFFVTLQTSWNINASFACNDNAQQCSDGSFHQFRYHFWDPAIYMQKKTRQIR